MSHTDKFAEFRARREVERAREVKVTWRKVSDMTGGGWSALGKDGALGFVNPKRPSGYEYGLRDGKDKPVAGEALTLARAKEAVEKLLTESARKSSLALSHDTSIVHAVNNVNTLFTGGTKMKRTLTVTAPDGTVLTRTTDRVYTHAVLVGPTEYRPGWGAHSFCGTPALAAKALAKVQRVYAGKAEVVLAEVTDPKAAPTEPTTTPAAPAAPTTTAAPTARKEAPVATATEQSTDSITAEAFAGSIEGVDAVRAAKAPTARLRANGKTLAYADDRKDGFVLSIAAEAIEPLPAKEKAKVEIKGRRATLRVTAKNAKGAAALVAALAKRAA